MADRPSLLLGAMELYDPDGTEFGCEVLVEGTSRGKAVPIVETIETFLEQGAIEVTQGWESREVPIRVTFTSSDLLDGLTAAEVALIDELNKVNTLVWTPWHPDLPGDHLGTPIVFDVINSWLEPVEGERWDLDEIGTVPAATYQIRLVCRSFVHTLATTIVDTVTTTASPTTTNLNTASSTTGWSGTVAREGEAPAALTVTLVGGNTVELSKSMAVTSTSPTERYAFEIQLPTGMFPLSAVNGNFLLIDYTWAAAWPDSVEDVYLEVNDSTVRLYPVRTSITGANQMRLVFDLSDASVAIASITDFDLHMTQVRNVHPLALDARTYGIVVDLVAQAVAIPAIGGPKEQLREAVVNGSAPALGSIEVNHTGTESLGMVLVYSTCDAPTAYNPAGRPHRVSGGTVTASTDAYSGEKEPLNSSPTFDYPGTSITDGEYLVLISARAESGTLSRTITWTLSSRLNSTLVGDAESYTTAIEMTAAFGLHRLGMIHLPVAGLPDHPDAKVRVVVSDSVAGSVLDNVYLLNMTTGQLTQVDCGSGVQAVGGPSKYLWIDAPDVLNDGRGAIVRGHSADRSDAFSAYPDAVEVGRHIFDPRGIVKILTLAAPNGGTDLRLHYKATGLTRLMSDW